MTILTKKENMNKRGTVAVVAKTAIIVDDSDEQHDIKDTNLHTPKNITTCVMVGLVDDDDDDDDDDILKPLTHQQSEIDYSMYLTIIGLVRVLATNPQLQWLELGGGDLVNTGLYSRQSGDDPYEVVKSFANALSTNTNLKELVIRSDSICWDGKNYLLKAINGDNSMDTIVRSNHTCKVSISGCKMKLINEEYEWNQGEPMSVKSKLLYAAGTFNENCINVEHFMDMPIELMPKLLEFLQEVDVFESIREDQKEVAKVALKNVYQLMKNIVAPFLDS